MATEGSHQQLCNRFLPFIRFVDRFLQFTGIFLVQPAVGSNNKYLMIKRWLWSCLCLIFTIESGIYIFIFRGLRAVVRTIYSTGYRVMAENFNNSLIRLSSFFVEMPTHFFLLKLASQSTFQKLCETLEPVDFLLERPNLITIYYYSIASLICTAWTVLINSICAATYELSNCWPMCGRYLLGIIQNIIRNVSTLHTSMGLWLFVICGELLVIYNRKIIQDLLKANQSSTAITTNNEIKTNVTWSILSQFKILHDVHRQLFYDYRFILMANVCCNVIFILTCSFYFIEYLDSTWVGIFWEIAVVTEFIFRFWLVCHTEDRIRTSAMECIPAIRQLRDKMTSQSERTKMTNFIVELNSLFSSKSKDAKIGFDLFGVLPLHKNLMLHAMEAILTFLIVIYQFESV